MWENGDRPSMLRNVTTFLFRKPSMGRIWCVLASSLAACSIALLALWIYISWDVFWPMAQEALTLSLQLKTSVLSSVGLLAYAIVLGIKAWREGADGMRAHAIKHLLESLIPAVIALSVVFFYYLFYAVPKRIFADADRVSISLNLSPPNAPDYAYRVVRVGGRVVPPEGVFLSFDGTLNASDYEPGALVSGIRWEPGYVRCDLGIRNTANMAIDNLDISVRTDLLITKASQLDSTPDIHLIEPLLNNDAQDNNPSFDPARPNPGLLTMQYKDANDVVLAQFTTVLDGKPRTIAFRKEDGIFSYRDLRISSTRLLPRAIVVITLIIVGSDYTQWHRQPTRPKELHVSGSYEVKRDGRKYQIDWMQRF
jgi:hypothetical protein